MHCRAQKHVSRDSVVNLTPHLVVSNTLLCGAQKVYLDKLDWCRLSIRPRVAPGDLTLFSVFPRPLEDIMANAFTTEAFTLLGVGVSIVALRLVARTKLVGLRGLQLDDYLMCFATVCLPIRVHVLCGPVVHSTLTPDLPFTL
jgi:hypothetical protein